MYYLKCQSCGLLNEVRTEFQVFCTGCNKKIDTNFRDWQARYPEEVNFEDFKRLVCVSEAEIPREPVKTKKSGIKGWKFWAAFIVSFAIFSVIGQLAGEKLMEIFRSEPSKVEETILKQEWVRDTYGDYGLSVETPEKLTKDAIKFPDNIKEFIENSSSYSSKVRGFEARVISVRYKPVIGEGDLQGGADGAINEMKAQKGVTDFHYEERNVFVSNVHGIEQKGNFKMKNFGAEFINNIFVKGLNAWQILVIYRVDDNIGRKAARKLMESIEIKY